MKLKYTFFACVLLCSALSFGFSGDDDPLKNLLSKLQRYRKDYAQEKIHIHTDKPYYSIGDTIWFKSYLVNSQSNQLSDLSKILYVELINEKDSIKKSLRLPVVAGLAWGDFTLSDSLAEGNYRIRAYTNWMRNFDESYFFDKTIKIGNSLSSQIISNVVYSFSKVGVRENVTALISYSDLNGKPLTSKEVTYDIQLDFRNILKGKGLTDSTGTLKVNFVNTQPFILKSGKINTKIKIDDRFAATKTFPIKTTSADIDLQFFPESGSLITNIRSRVAFKAIAADGLSRKVSGSVSDQNGNKVADFSSEFAGMGSFTFTPLKDNTYTATIKFDDGSEKKAELPRAKDEGAFVSINSTSPESLAVKVVTTIPNSGPDDEVILIGQSNGVVHFISRNKLIGNSFSSTISKNRFPAGIIQFTLFNSSYQPLAERLVFIRPGKNLQVKVSTDKTAYKPRERVRLTLDAIDSAGQVTQGSFSLSVTDESQIPFDDVDEITIQSNLLLSSELKGHIEKPNYYFTDVTDAKDRALDNLMLTQGWRKFEWQKISSETFPILAFIPERSITISGKVLNFNGSPSAGAKVTLLSSTGTGMILDTLTDVQGLFNFNNLKFTDSTSFVVQALNAKGKKNVEIQIDRVPAQMVTKNQHAASAEINVNQSLLPYLKTRSQQFDEMRRNGMLRRSIVLAEVKVIEVKPKVKNSSNLNGSGNADAVVSAADLQNCSNLVTCLQGRVAGLIIQNGVAYLTRNLNSSFSGPVPMQLIVDGMYVEASFLSAISINDVESIEVLKSIGNTAIYGIRGGGGVLIITTKRGERNLNSRNFAPGMSSHSPQGYHIARKFYSPNYEAPQQTPDLRSTIFWAPNLITGNNSKTTVEFFTADKPGTYKVVTEGLDLNGSLVRQVYRFSVQ